MGATKSNGKKKTKRRMTKNLKHQVEAIAKQAVQEVRETKYISDSLNAYTTLTGASAGVDVPNSRMLYRLSLVIPNGDDYRSREGDKVLLKSLVLRLRIKPRYMYDVYPTGVIPGSQLFTKTTLRFHILRIDKTSQVSASEIDQCIRRPQEEWFDTKQAIGRSSRKQFTIIDKFEVPLEYRDVSGLDSTTVPPETVILRLPKMSFVTKRIQLDKVTLFNATSFNQPVKYDYYLYGTWGRYNRGGYVNQIFPDTLDIWKSYLFKDM